MTKVQTNVSSARPARGGGELSEACHAAACASSGAVGSVGHTAVGSQAATNSGTKLFTKLTADEDASSLWKWALKSQQAPFRWALTECRSGALTLGQP